MPQKEKNGAEFGLIVQQPGKPQAVLRSFVAPMLNFKYGLHTVETSELHEAVPAIRGRVAKMRCVFLIQNTELRSDAGLSGLNLMGKYPLFVLVPHSLEGYYGNIPQEAEGNYSPAVLEQLKIGDDELASMRDSLGEELLAEVKQLMQT